MDPQFARVARYGRQKLFLTVSKRERPMKATENSTDTEHQRPAPSIRRRSIGARILEKILESLQDARRREAARVIRTYRSLLSECRDVKADSRAGSVEAPTPLHDSRAPHD